MKKNNKFWGVLLSLVIAFGFWLYVVTVVSPEQEATYYDIPVILQNDNVLAERGLMITSDPPKVTLKLLGNRTDLINLNENNINVLTNVASIEAPGTHMLGYTVSYPGNVPINSVTKQHGTPAMITLKVENRIKKSVPVILSYAGSVPEDFIADKENAELSHPEVALSGPESVISKIEQAVIQVNLEGQNKSIVGEFPYTLCDASGDPVDAELVTTNTDMVNLKVKIQRVKEISLTVNVIDGGGATKDTCAITINPPKIRVSGSDALLEKMDTLELGTIDLGKLLKDEELTFPIKLDEGITNETGVTDAAVQVKFPNLQTREFNVTNITPINVPEGLEVDMITQALSVKLRGPKLAISTMKESEIQVTVDFTGAELGTATMAAIITIPEQYNSVGALNSYSVSATLREPTTETIGAGE